MAANSSPVVALLTAEEEQIQEATVESSLARLQEMHVTLRHLRDTIPRVVSSIQAAESIPDPADLYTQFSSAATGAGRDIQGFMRMMRDERANEVFEQVKKSKETDGEGIEVWRVADYEGWLDVKKEVKAEEVEGEVEEVEQSIGNQIEDRQKIVEGFRAAHPAIEVDLADILTVKLPSPVDMNFSLAYTDEAGSGHNWKITSITSSSLQETRLTKSIMDGFTASGRKFKDLRSILEMVASYSDITNRPCSKCNRPIDRTGHLPVVRSIKRTKQADGQFTTQWLALHQACT